MTHPSKVKLEQLFPWSCCFFREQLLPQNQTSLQEFKARLRTCHTLHTGYDLLYECAKDALKRCAATGVL